MPVNVEFKKKPSWNVQLNPKHMWIYPVFDTFAASTSVLLLKQVIDQSKKYGQDWVQSSFSYGSSRKSLGTRLVFGDNTVDT